MASSFHMIPTLSPLCLRYVEKRVLEQHIARLNEEVAQRDRLDSEMEVRRTRVPPDEGSPFARWWIRPPTHLASFPPCLHPMYLCQVCLCGMFERLKLLEETNRQLATRLEEAGLSSVIVGSGEVGNTTASN